MIDMGNIQPIGECTNSWLVAVNAIKMGRSPSQWEQHSKEYYVSVSAFTLLHWFPVLTSLENGQWWGCARGINKSILSSPSFCAMVFYATKETQTKTEYQKHTKIYTNEGLNDRGATKYAGCFLKLKKNHWKI